MFCKSSVLNDVKKQGPLVVVESRRYFDGSKKVGMEATPAFSQKQSLQFMESIYYHLLISSPVGEDGGQSGAVTIYSIRY